MTTTTITNTIPVIDRLLEAVEAGHGADMADLYAPDAVLDATVPGWRFQADGPTAIAAEYGKWFTHPSRLEDIVRRTVPDGEVVTYLMTWIEGGVPHAAHHCHVLTVGATGHIAREQVWCGGRWDAALLAEMAAAGHAG